MICQCIALISKVHIHRWRSAHFPSNWGCQGSRRKNCYHHSTAPLLRRLLRRALYAGTAFQAVLGFSAPESGVVAAGNATITTSGSETLVRQGSSSAIVNWDRFDIGANEQVHFVQPDAQSWILNRDLSGATSQIHGRMLANGRVFIQNAAGVLIGSGASIDVGSFVATTADVADDDFMAGDLRFFGGGETSAAVTNLGTIEVGSGGVVALIGGRVSNAGVIHASVGKVVLAAAAAFTLDFDGDGLLTFSADSVLKRLGGVDQSGEITSGTVLLTARIAEQVLDSVVNLSGVVRAVGVSGAGGRIVLHAGAGGISRVSGTADASGSTGGQRGGEVDVLGNRVVVEGTGVVDVTGMSGGGRVRIGGGFQGNNPAIDNAEVTGIGPDVEIRAAATGAGSGGRVIVWADGVTRFYGSIDVSGTGVAGTGGFVEVSGKVALDFRGEVKLAGAAGGGALLLDPTNITLVNAGDGTNNADVRNPTTDNFELLTTDLPAADATLDANFIVAANANVTLQATDDISVIGEFAVGTGITDVNLMLSAGDRISLMGSGALELAGTGSNLTLAARVIAGDLNGRLAVTDNLILSAGSAISLDAEVVVGKELSVNALGNAYLSGASNDFGTLSAVAASLVLEDTNTLFLDTISVTESLMLGAGSLIQVVVAASVVAPRVLMSVGAALVLNSASNDFGLLSLMAGTATVVDINTLSIGNISVATALTLNAGRDIRSEWGTSVQAHSAVLSAALGELVLASATLVADLSLRAAGDINQTGALSVGGIADVSTPQWVILNRRANDLSSLHAQAEEVTLRDKNNLIVGNISTSSLTLSVGGSVGDVPGSSVEVVDALVSAQGALVLNQPGNDWGQISISVASATLADLSGMVLASALIGGDLSLVSSGDISQTGRLQVGGTGYFSTAGDIVLTIPSNNFGIFRASAGSVTLFDIDALQLGNISVVSALTLHANGELIAAGSTSVVAPDALLSADGAVVLHPDSNDFGRLSLRASTATLGDTDALTLLSSSLSGVLDLRSGGDISQSGALTAGSVGRFSTPAKLVLGEAGNDFGTLYAQAVTATLVDANALVVGDISVSMLTISSGGSLSALASTSVVAPDALLSIGGSLVLEGVGHDFGALNLRADTATLTDVSALTLLSSSLSGVLDLRSGGDISQSGALTAGSVGRFSTPAKLVLGAAGNDFGTLYAQAVTATLVDANALVVGDISVSMLTISSGGSLSALASTSVVAPDALLSVGGALVMDGFSNDFGVLSLSADTATLVDTNALMLSDISVASALTLIAGGVVSAVTSSSVVAPDALLSANGAVVLHPDSNDFGRLSLRASTATLGDTDALTLLSSSLSGVLDLRSGGDISQIGALTAGSVGRFSTPAQLVLGAAGNDFGTLYAQAVTATLVDANALVVGDISVSMLTISSGGSLSALASTSVVAPDALLSAGGAVVLHPDSNDFGRLSLRASTATLGDTDALTLLSSSLSGVLDLRSGGDISQSGALTAGSVGRFSTPAQLVLGAAGNDFGTLYAQAVTATLVDANALVVGDISVSMLTISSGGSLSALASTSVVAPDALLSVGGAVVLHPDSNDFGRLSLRASTATLGDTDALTLLSSSLSGVLDLRSGGDISQSGALTAGSVGRFSTPAWGQLVLGAAGNDFGTLYAQAVTATLVDANALVVGDISVSMLTISSGGSLSALASTSVVAPDALLSVGGALVMDGFSNDFGVLSLSADTATLADTNALMLSDISVASALTLIAGGVVSAVTSSSVVAPDALLSANGAVVLHPDSNDFGRLSLRASTATLGDTDALTLLSSSLSGVLDLRSGGDISQSGALTAGSVGRFSTPAKLVLGAAGNDFGTLYAQAVTATLVDANALVVGDISVSMLTISSGGSLSALASTSVVAPDALLSAGGAVVLHPDSNDFGRLSLQADTATLGDTDALTLLSSSLSGVLDLRSGGDISQSGALTAGSVGRFSTPAQLVLGEAGNDFGTLYAQAVTATLVDANALVVGDISVSMLTISSGGSLSALASTSVVAPDALLSIGGSLVLEGVGHDFGALNLRADTATLTDVSALTLLSSSLSGVLDLRSGGDISQIGALTAGSVGRFSTPAQLVLGAAGNDFGTLYAQAVTATLVDANALVVGDISVSMLTISSGGSLSALASTSVVAPDALLSVGGALVMDGFSNDFGVLSLSADTATLVDTNALMLSDISVASALTLIAGGVVSAVTSSSVVAPDALLSADGAVVLHPDSNDFGRLSLRASTATLGDTDALTLLSSSLSGVLDLRSGGDISQIGALTAGSVGRFSTPAKLVLGAAGNDFGTLYAQAVTATLVDANALVVGDISVSMLTISSGGSLSALASTSVVAPDALLSADGAVVLHPDSNDFGRLSLQADTATLGDTDVLTLLSSSLSGVLDLRSGGDISQSGALTAGSVGRFSTPAKLVLGEAGNDFGTLYAQAVTATLVDANALVVGDISVSMLTISSGGSLSALASTSVVAPDALLSIGGSLVLEGVGHDFGALNLRADTATLTDVSALTLLSSSLSGVLDLRSGGDISQSGALTAGSVGRFSTPAQLVLGAAGNDFGTLYAQAVTATLVDANALVVGDISVSMLTISSGGSLSALASTSVVAPDALLSVGGALVMDGFSNDFGVLSLSADTATLADTNALKLGNISVAGGLTLDVQGDIGVQGLIRVQADTGVLSAAGELVLALATFATDLTLSAAGDISQTGSLSVGGVLDISSSQWVVLNRRENDFGLLYVRAAAVTLADTNDLTLGNVSTSNLVISADGAVTSWAGTSVQAAEVRVSAGGVLVFDQVSNDLGSLSVTAASAFVVDANTLVLATALIDADLKVTVGGDISQTSRLVVGGTGTFSATGDVVLAVLGNMLGQINAESDSVTLYNSDGLQVGNINVSALTLRVGGDLVGVGGTSVIALNALLSADGAVVLGNSSNNFGQLSLTVGSATLGDTDTLTLAAGIVRGHLTLSAGGGVSQSGALTVAAVGRFTTGSDLVLDNPGNSFGTLYAQANTATLVETNGMVLGNVMVSTLTISSGGALSAVASTSVQAVNTLIVVKGAVVLHPGSNDFRLLSLTANSATLGVTDGVTLVASALSGGLSLSSAGDISQSGALTVGAVGQFSAASGLVLNHPGNSFGTLYAQADTATLVESGALVLGNVSVSSMLTISSGGALGALASTSVVALNALLSVGGVLVLNNPGNNFSVLGLYAASGTLIDADALVLAASSVLGDLSLSTGGDLSQSGAVTLGGTLSLCSEGEIVLENSANSFGLLRLKAVRVAIGAFSSLTLGSGSSVLNALTLHSQQDISQSGALTLGSNITLSSDGSLVLTDRDNNLGLLSISASSATLVDRDDFVFGSNLSTTGGLTISAAGDISQSGAVGAGLLSLSAGGGVSRDVDPTDTTPVFTEADSLTLYSAGNITLDGNGTMLRLLRVVAEGDISQSGALTMAVLEASALQDVVLDHPSNDFDSVALTAATATLADRNDIALGASTIGGTLDISAGGTISQTDALLVQGAIELDTPQVVRLLDADNDFATLKMRADSASLVDTNALVIGDVAVANRLYISTAGDIRGLGGTSVIAPDAEFATGGDLILESTSNDFNRLSTHAFSATLFDRSALTLVSSSLVSHLLLSIADEFCLEGILTVGGNMTLSAGGRIHQAGGSELTVAGALSLSTPSDVILFESLPSAQPANRISTLHAQARNLSLLEGDGLILGEISMSSVLLLSVHSDISSSPTTSVLADRASMLAVGSVVLDTATRVEIQALSVSAQALALDATSVDANGYTRPLASLGSVGLSVAEGVSLYANNSLILVVASVGGPVGMGRGQYQCAVSDDSGRSAVAAGHQSGQWDRCHAVRQYQYHWYPASEQLGSGGPQPHPDRCRGTGAVGYGAE